MNNCRTCEKDKELKEFNLRKSGRPFLDCKTCENEEKLNRYHAMPSDKKKDLLKRKLWKYHNLPAADKNKRTTQIFNRTIALGKLNDSIESSLKCAEYLMENQPSLVNHVKDIIPL